MPSSKEVRARQNRQKERVAAQRAERARQRQRRKRFGGAVVVILLVIVVVLGLTLGGGTKNNTVAVAPTVPTASTIATTTTTGAPPPHAPCVGMKDPIPKGSPPFLIGPGPAPTKLATQDLKVGTGALVAPNVKVTMNYVGVACSTGKIFDTSFKTGSQPFPADLSPAGGLIVGWQQGIPGMKIGGVRLLSIPSNLAYGPGGRAPLIAKNEPLYFLVQAVKLG